MKFGIVIFPSKKVQDYANSLRRRYDPHYALIPPHLTLKDPFEATEEEVKDITKKIATIAKNFHPIDINIKKIGSFKPVNNVIYLKVDSPEELEKLHNELSTAFDGEQEYNFVPHITLGQKMSDDEHSDVYSSLRMTKVDFEQTADRIHLLYQLENGSWTVYETFHLGKE
ncbi:YjcG family protein [Bacillus sp. REN3]|uniref:YjcG family protein n=1 Tax=Bacillus sp. REN3 TaxID=2802440 RepID=UPI001AEF300E|nr:YjcG family protein [Bacillus sp. REN3]